MNPWRQNARMHNHVNVRDEIPDPYPQAKLKHIWADSLVMSRIKFNRLALYDGRRLHNQYLHEDSYKRLSLDAKTGRLTLNSFYWMDPKKEDEYFASKRKVNQHANQQEPVL